MLAALSPKAAGETFNVATGIETSVDTLAHLILELCELDREPAHIERRDIDNIRRRVLNIEKIRRMLGWIPLMALKEGLHRTWEWFREL
jgi:UDP-glucose 4-epimerase